MAGDRAGATVGTLNRVPLRDQAFDVLRKMVVSGALASGDRLNEADLASRLGISRGPLREAIQKLGAEGFVEFRQNRGAFVRTISLEQVSHMYEVRELIEVYAARLAAERATAEGIARLRSLLDSAEDALSGEADSAYPPELDLHELVLELAGNPYLQRVGVDLQNQVRLARVKSGSAPERARQALAEHRKIINAISKRNADAAGKAMADHLHKSHQHIVESYS